MKFVKISTEYTREEMDIIENNINEETTIKFKKLFRSFSYVQFLTEDKKICLYALIDDDTLNTLFSEYVKIEINFTYEDISKSILFGYMPIVKSELGTIDLNNMIDKFIDEHLNIDTVLDKISELGINNLTEKDKKILEMC